jgi:2-dehydro-3-deoxygluconokinase
MYDIVTVGEGMLRLSPPAYERLRRATTLDMRVCGSQGNVACNFGRLGMKSAFVTKLPDSALGLLLKDFYMSCGVDTGHIQFVPDSRLGVNFIEFGATPRASSAIYDRRNSAASTISPSDFDWDSILNQTRIAYTDGIFPGLSESCRKTAFEFIAAAKRNNCLVGFDLNYREHLWNKQEAAAVISDLLMQVDILIATRGDIEALFDIKGNEDDVVRRAQDRFGCRLVGMTLGKVHRVQIGEIGGIACHEGRCYQGHSYEVDAIDRFGAGDAWGTGLMYGYLVRDDIEYAVEFANAMCAADFTMPGDVAHVGVDEIEAMMGNPDYRVTR